MMTYPHLVATHTEMEVLEHADRLAALLEVRWDPATSGPHDEVMLLVADLLRAHADTGIEMQTWRAAIDVVTSHLAQDPKGRRLLRQVKLQPWHTVIGTWRDGAPETLAVVPGRRRLEVSLGCWQRQLQACTVADAARAASSGL